MPDKKTQGLREKTFHLIKNGYDYPDIIECDCLNSANTEYHLCEPAGQNDPKWGFSLDCNPENCFKLKYHDRAITKHNEQAAQAAAEEINTNIFEIKNPEVEFKKMSDNSFQITAEKTKATCNHSDVERDKQIILKHLQKKWNGLLWRR